MVVGRVGCLHNDECLDRNGSRQMARWTEYITDGPVNIAIIPARGGSKRIRNKNVREFCGRPMIAWSIDAARNSSLFDQIVVSTDCSQIAEVARQCGARVPFMRPAELSDDHTPTIPVIRHAIEQLASAGRQADFVCCIYATAPFIEPNDLHSAWQLLQSDPDLEFAFPVATFAFPIFRALRIENDRTTMIWPEHELTRSQDLPETFHDAGQFYFGRTTAFHTREGFFSANSAPVVLPRERVQDIDSEEDWARAEAMFRARESLT
jgi:N-acylneuraminate cytidylyltransferase